MGEHHSPTGSRALWLLCLTYKPSMSPGNLLHSANMYECLLGARLHHRCLPRFISPLSPTTRFVPPILLKGKLSLRGAGWPARSHRGRQWQAQGLDSEHLTLWPSRPCVLPPRKGQWSGLGWLCPHVGLLTSSTSALRLGNRVPGQCQDLDDALPPGSGVPKVLR